MSPQTELRLILLAAGLVVVTLIYFLGKPRRPTPNPRREPVLGPNRRAEVKGDVRREPSLGLTPTELQDGVDEPPVEIAVKRPLASSVIGAELPPEPERVVTLYLRVRDNHLIHGAELRDAAEKAGLKPGERGIFHRMRDGGTDRRPIFSVANLSPQGTFDFTHLDATTTQGLAFFMTLPGPLPALDAWETMLPIAQRLAERLDAVLLDETRSALNRQLIAHIRDELRTFDRQRRPLKSPRGFW